MAQEESFASQIDKIAREAESAEEAIRLVKELALSSQGVVGNRYNPDTGKVEEATTAQKIEGALAQLAQSAQSRQVGRFPGSAQEQLARGLGSNTGLVAATEGALSSDPSTWLYKPGQTFERDGFKMIVVDPNKKTLTQEEKDLIKSTEGRVAFVNPITGYSMPFDPTTGKVFPFGQGPTSQKFDAEGNVIEQDFSQDYLGSKDYFNKFSQSNPKKVVTTKTPNPDGTVTVTYSDGTRSNVSSNEAAGLVIGSPTSPAATDAATAERQSAYDLLYSQFKQYGLDSLVTPLRDLIVTGASPAEFTIKLRETPQYKKRFAANEARIQKGLTAISEAEYLGLEDQYQNIMRNYGLPAEYYTRGDMGVQEGFNKFIANDVSAAELEDRVMTAQQRVMNANPEVLASLKAFYPGINNGDILAYALDPQKALTDIKRKVTAAEIGGAATQAGLGITGTRAEELGAAGINKAQAQQGFQTVAEVAPRGGQLAAIYGESPYTQQTAEQEVFGLAGSTEAAKQRKKLVGLERAAFSGQTGAAQGALGRERAGVL